MTIDEKIELTAAIAAAIKQYGDIFMVSHGDGVAIDAVHPEAMSNFIFDKIKGRPEIIN